MLGAALHVWLRRFTNLLVSINRIAIHRAIVIFLVSIPANARTVDLRRKKRLYFSSCVSPSFLTSLIELSNIKIAAIAMVDPSCGIDSGITVNLSDEALFRWSAAKPCLKRLR